MNKPNYNQVGVIWKGKKDKNGKDLPHTLQFTEGFVPKAGAWYQCHTKVFKEKDIKFKIEKGWLDEEQAKKAEYVVAQMSDLVLAEVIEVLKKD